MNLHDVENLVTPVVDNLGLEVDRIEKMPAGKRSVLRISLDGDGPDGRGPSLDDIAEATRAISAALDASTVTGNQAYTLEVSTRGVTRPLTEPRHYRRNRGRLVALRLVEGEPWTARIMEAGPDSVTVEAEGERREIPYTQITKAVVQVELNRPTEEE